MGSEEDKNQESLETEVLPLMLNQEQATILYLSTVKSEEETKEALKLFNEQLKLKPEEREEEFLENGVIHENIRLAKFTLEKLRYLIGELKTIITELEPLDVSKGGLIKRPEWG